MPTQEVSDPSPTQEEGETIIENESAATGEITSQDKIDHYRAAYRDLLRRRKEKKGFGLDAGKIVQGYAFSMIEHAKGGERDPLLEAQDLLQEELDAFAEDRQYRKIQDQIRADFNQVQEVIARELKTKEMQEHVQGEKIERQEEVPRAKKFEIVKEVEAPPKTIEEVRERIREVATQEYINQKRATMEEAIQQETGALLQVMKEALGQFTGANQEMADALQRGEAGYLELASKLAEYQAYEVIGSEIDEQLLLLQDFKTMAEVNAEASGTEAKGVSEIEQLIEQQSALKNKYQETMKISHDAAIDQWKNIEQSIKEFIKNLQTKIEKVKTLLQRQVRAEHLREQHEAAQAVLKEQLGKLESTRGAMDQWLADISNIIVTYGEVSMKQGFYKIERSAPEQGVINRDENEDEKIVDLGKERNKREGTGDGGRTREKAKREKTDDRDYYYCYGRANEVYDIISKMPEYKDVSIGSFSELRVKAIESLISRESDNSLGDTEARMWKEIWKRVLESSPDIASAYKRQIDTEIASWHSNPNDQNERAWALWTIVYRNRQGGSGEYVKEELKKAA